MMPGTKNPQGSKGVVLAKKNDEVVLAFRWPNIDSWLLRRK